MKNAVPVTAINMEPEEVEEISIKTSYRPWMRWLDLVSLVLVSASIFLGMGFWQEWFVSVDRILCIFLIAIGLLVALIRSHWTGELSRRRVAMCSILVISSVVLMAVSVVTGQPKWCGAACGLAFAGWGSARLLGERFHYCLFLGSVMTIPFQIDAFTEFGAFEEIESLATTVSSGLADSFELSHVREGNR